MWSTQSVVGSGIDEANGENGDGGAPNGLSPPPSVPRVQSGTAVSSALLSHAYSPSES